jgi:hypothetical protein
MPSQCVDKDGNILKMGSKVSFNGRQGTIVRLPKDDTCNVEIEWADKQSADEWIDSRTLTLFGAGGKRKWPFYGHRTTRRRGGGPNEDRALAQAKMVLAGRMRALRQAPGNPALIQAVKDATEAVQRARNAKTDTEKNPFYGAPPNIRPSAQEIAQQQLNEGMEEEKENRELLEELETEHAAETEAAAAANAKAKSDAERNAAAKAATAEEKAEAAADAKAIADAKAAARAEYLRQINANLKTWIHLKFGTLSAEEQADKFEEYKANLEKNAEFWKSVNATLNANLDAAYNKLKAAAKAAASAGQTVKVTAANIGKYLNPAQGIASLKSTFNEWANKRAEAQFVKEIAQKKKDEDTADIIRKRAKAKGKSDEEADALKEEFLKTTAFKRKEAKDAQRAEDQRNAYIRRTNRENNAMIDAAKKDYNKKLAAYESLKEKYDKDIDVYNEWVEKDKKYNECDAKYGENKRIWLDELNAWLATLDTIAKELSSDQILRLQSRGVGSSLMLDEARKLMIDADEQQRTVMESKTDLQFTLASSSDADIAKAVGFYEAELQKLKTCMSKGKEDAIAEYEKDLAEIEKKKKEITAKTFEVKAPQDNQQQQGNTDYLKSMTKTQLTAEIAKLKNEKGAIKPNPGQTTLSGKQNKRIASIDTKIKFANTRLNDPSTPAGGNRRMTMRRRRV